MAWRVNRIVPSRISADVTGVWQITTSRRAADGTVEKDSGVAFLKQNGAVVTGSLGPGRNRTVSDH